MRSSPAIPTPTSSSSAWIWSWTDCNGPAALGGGRRPGGPPRAPRVRDDQGPSDSCSAARAHEALTQGEHEFVGTHPDRHTQAFVQLRADQARSCAYKLRNSGKEEQGNEYHQQRGSERPESHPFHAVDLRDLELRLCRHHDAVLQPGTAKRSEER